MFAIDTSSARWIILLGLAVNAISKILGLIASALDRRVPNLALWVARSALKLIPLNSREFYNIEGEVKAALDEEHRYGGLRTAMSFLIRSAPRLAIYERTRAERRLLAVQGGTALMRIGVPALCLVAATLAGVVRTETPAGIVAISAPSGESIEISEAVAPNLVALLAAAERDGIRLGGYGYRHIEEQIAARRANCGESDYEIYEAPVSKCRIPTARPGTSSHEHGNAVDFSYEGETVCFPLAGSKCQDNPAYRWLAQNAETYGFKNVPSEAWHWSTTGR